MVLRSALLLVLVSLVALVSQAQGQKGDGKKKGPKFEGVITQITYGKGNEDATITVLHDQHKGKKKDKNIGQERTFQVDLNTKIDRVDDKGPGKKGKGKKGKDKDPLRFTALKKGMHVVIHYRGNHAEEITLISEGGGGKKGKGKGKG